MLRLALVTEGMIHRSLDELMDWLDVHVPAVRDLEIGTGGYSPLGHSPLELSSRDRGAWLAHVEARGYRVAAFKRMKLSRLKTCAPGCSSRQIVRAGAVRATSSAIPSQ